MFQSWLRSSFPPTSLRSRRFSFFSSLFVYTRISSSPQIFIFRPRSYLHLIGRSNLLFFIFALHIGSQFDARRNVHPQRPSPSFLMLHILFFTFPFLRRTFCIYLRRTFCIITSYFPFLLDRFLFYSYPAYWQRGASRGGREVFTAWRRDWLCTETACSSVPFNFNFFL